MSETIFLDCPSNFSYRFTVRSHGWYDLAPLVLTGSDELTCVLSRGDGGSPMSVSVSEVGGKLKISVDAAIFDRDGVISDVRHILRLDEHFTDFYMLVEKHERVSWVRRENAGRLLRSPTVWEDLVKSICTTNCSWSLTKIMVTNLVEKLGASTPHGKHAFPTAAAMAAHGADFYREEIRAGYRSPYFSELATRAATGEIDTESWATSKMTTPDLKKEMKSVKGVGDYAAENLLKLVGRYDGLALDSYLRGQFYKKHNTGKKCTDKKIERHYHNFGPWRGLAIWCDMTEDWFSENGQETVPRTT